MEAPPPLPDDPPESYFAPASRATPAHLRRLAEASLADPVIRVVLDSVGGMVAVINRERQILAANAELLAGLGLTSMDTLHGLRFGEAFHCENVPRGPDGCGTSPACRHCGGVLTQLAAQAADHPVDGECALTRRVDGRFECAEYRVRGTPVTLVGEQVVIFVLHDISAMKRRQVLEEVFFHDIRNTLAGLTGWGDLLQEETQAEAARHIVALSRRLTNELSEQHLLLRAEQGRLEPRLKTVRVTDILRSVRQVVESLECAAGRSLTMPLPSVGARIHTDETLLSRVLVNMLKNALEATPVGGEIRVWFKATPGRPTFAVHNTGGMPPEVAERVFHRSFSTKPEAGRGIGAYSMRLLGEQVLGGRVGFTTSHLAGTTFFIELPATADPAAGG